MKTLILISTLAGAFLFFACTKDQVHENVDQLLYEMALDSEGYQWFQFNDSLYEKSTGSGHNWPFLKTRYNSIAQSQLNSQGNIQSNASFPEGSVVVKELFADSSTIGRYALLWKNSNHKYADQNGWVWGYVNGDGTVAIPASQKGGSCISCHSQSENIDYMLMNKYFP